MKTKKNDRFVEYAERDAVLQQMGFISYGAYLQSDLWKFIRNFVLNEANRRCAICGNRASQVHHTEYSKATLSGMRTGTMKAICKACHEMSEFDEWENKTPLATANLRLDHFRAFVEADAPLPDWMEDEQPAPAPAKKLPTLRPENTSRCANCGRAAVKGTARCRPCKGI